MTEGVATRRSMTIFACRMPEVAAEDLTLFHNFVTDSEVLDITRLLRLTVAWGLTATCYDRETVGLTATCYLSRLPITELTPEWGKLCTIFFLTFIFLS